MMLDLKLTWRLRQKIPADATCLGDPDNMLKLGHPRSSSRLSVYRLRLTGGAVIAGRRI